MATFDNDSRPPFPQNGSDFWTSKNAGLILEQLKAHVVPPAPATATRALQLLILKGYLESKSGSPYNLTDQARALITHADKSAKDQRINEYVDLAVEVAKALYRPDAFKSDDPQRQERYALLGASMTEADFAEIDRRFTERLLALHPAPPEPR